MCHDHIEKLIGQYGIDASQFLYGIQDGCPVNGTEVKIPESVTATAILRIIAKPPETGINNIHLCYLL
ncbi:MAG TPA: hypothetical protein DCZ97_03080 [Syntrophus sp. (in: bacteria)]|nr:hypothetical protein [Syntrophus sp. (in: bacteria)]